MNQHRKMSLQEMTMKLCMENGDGMDDHRQHGNAKMEPNLIDDPCCLIRIIFFFHYFY